VSVFCLIEKRSGMKYGDAVFRMGPQHYEKTDEKAIKEYERLQEENKSCKDNSLISKFT
jgi:hypothetical protein